MLPSCCKLLQGALQRFELLLQLYKLVSWCGMRGRPLGRSEFKWVLMRGWRTFGVNASWYSGMELSVETRVTGGGARILYP